MHHDQLAISVPQVASLVADQLPEWAGETIEQVPGSGTVHAIFLIGGQLAVRFPLRPGDPVATRAALEKGAAAAYELGLVSPFPVPHTVHMGDPGHGYPMPWSAQTWIEGVVATPTSCADSADVATDLLLLIGALREADTRGRHFAGTGRGGRLTDHDAWVAECLDRSEELLDTAPLRSLWSTLRTLPREDPDVMSHTDLIPGNLLLDDDHIVGVLDGGDFQAADPALDLVCAWHLLGPTTREILREGLSCSDVQWERGKAWAFEQAIGLHWYYRDTNPSMSEVGRTTLERLVEDL